MTELYGEAELLRKKKGNLDWVFANGESVLKSPHSASIEALAECAGRRNLRGTRGEYATFQLNGTYYVSAVLIIEAARPYLLSGDKAGWVEFCNNPNNKE